MRPIEKFEIYRQLCEVFYVDANNNYYSIDSHCWWELYKFIKDKYNYLHEFDLELLFNDYSIIINKKEQIEFDNMTNYINEDEYDCIILSKIMLIKKGVIVEHEKDNVLHDFLSKRL